MLRVMTWNIWSGKNWKDIVTFIKDNKVDVMGLQEVDVNYREITEFKDICKEIANELGFYYAFAASIEKNENRELRQYGNCIISRYPVHESKRHFLSPDIVWDSKTWDTEPRTLLETIIEVEGRKIAVMTTHLACASHFETLDIRMKQVESIMSILQAKEGMPVILMGDFNCLPTNKEIEVIKKHLIDVDMDNKLITWPTHPLGWPTERALEKPTYKIDYIFVSKDLSYSDVEAHHLSISDHAPVLATVNIPPVSL